MPPRPRGLIIESVAPATTTSCSPRSTRAAACATASAPAAQAETWAMRGPVSASPSASARSVPSIGARNATRGRVAAAPRAQSMRPSSSSGAKSSSSACSRPTAATSAAPRSTAVQPALRQASAAAARPSASLRSRPPPPTTATLAGRSGTSPATRTGNVVASKARIGPTAARPCARPSKNAAAPTPNAETTPTPEIAARLMPPP